jgi:TonB family protein
MQHRFSRAISIALAALSLAVPLAGGRGAGAQEAPPAGATRAQLLEQGEQLLAQQQYRRAIGVFEDANRLSESGCAECFLGLSRTYVAWGKARQGVETARQALQLNPPKPLLARGYHQLAVALLAQPGRGADAVAEAEGAFRKVLEIAPAEWNIDRFNLAALLLQGNRADEAVALARDYLTAAPSGSAALEARMLICAVRKGSQPADAAPEPGAEIEPPRPLYRQPAAPRRRVEGSGSVLVQVNIDRDGCAVKPTIVQGLGGELDSIALEAARRWVFQPATSQGKPVPADSMVSINFSKDTEQGKDPERVYRDKMLATWPVPR